MAFEASSAALTGERSGFVRHSILDRSIARIAAAARDTTPVRSSSPWARSQSRKWHRVPSCRRSPLDRSAIRRAPQGTPLAAWAAGGLCSRSMARPHHRRSCSGNGPSSRVRGMKRQSANPVPIDPSHAGPAAPRSSLPSKATAELGKAIADATRPTPGATRGTRVRGRRAQGAAAGHGDGPGRLRDPEPARRADHERQ